MTLLFQILFLKLSRYVCRMRIVHEFKKRKYSNSLLAKISKRSCNPLKNYPDTFVRYKPMVLLISHEFKKRNEPIRENFKTNPISETLERIALNNFLWEEFGRPFALYIFRNNFLRSFDKVSMPSLDHLIREELLQTLWKNWENSRVARLLSF